MGGREGDWSQPFSKSLILIFQGVFHLQEQQPWRGERGLSKGGLQVQVSSGGIAERMDYNKTLSHTNWTPQIWGSVRLVLKSWFCAFRKDGIYAVPENMTWPECYIKTTTAKPREQSPIHLPCFRIHQNIVHSSPENSWLSHLQRLWMQSLSRCWRLTTGQSCSSKSIMAIRFKNHHMKIMISIIIIRLTHSIIFADQLKAKNQGDKVGEMMI